ncbi:hypothetical protein, partial [Variovorax sp.]|uniref:hypothetical protein n=1 Tax=Variovorax sp. TaxID=1871043 RepID=UPI0025D3D160
RMRRKGWSAGTKSSNLRIVNKPSVNVSAPRIAKSFVGLQRQRARSTEGGRLSEVFQQPANRRFPGSGMRATTLHDFEIAVKTSF